jgi:hypothetical protein
MPGRASYTLTIRHGSDVRRAHFDELGEALAELERSAEQVRTEGPLEKVSGLRDFDPERQVHARLEISTGGLLRRRDAGVDVMGDGSTIPYVGGIRRRALEPRQGQDPYGAVAEALEAAS